MTTTATTHRKPARRDLRFETFDEVIADVRQLELGYERAGQWTMAQVCDHLGLLMRCSMEGFPRRGVPWPISSLLRRIALSKRAMSRPMPAGLPSPRFLRPVEDTVADAAERRRLDHEAAERFVEMAKRVKHYGGEWHPSPMFGELPPGMWRLLHIKHAAHHLSFLVPRGPIAPGRPATDADFSI